MECKYCNKAVEGKWNYCPHCGHKVEKNGIFGFINKQLDQLRRKTPSEEYENKVKQPLGGVTISITTSFGQPRISIGPEKGIQHSYQAQKIKRKHRKQPKVMLEPQTEIKRFANSVLVSVDLPGVKSDDDVDLNIFPNSVELRAYAGEKGYFKIINIPKEYGLVDKKLRNEQLKLQFSM